MQNSYNMKIDKIQIITKQFFIVHNSLFNYIGNMFFYQNFDMKQGLNYEKLSFQIDNLECKYIM